MRSPPPTRAPEGVQRATPFFERPQRVEFVGDEVDLRARYLYDEAGLLLREEGPGEAFVDYQRDASGRPTVVSTPGSVTRLEYDPRNGLPIREAVHDARSDELLEVTTTEYDAFGRWTLRTTPDGGQIERSYEVGRLGGLEIKETVTPRVGEPFTKTQRFDAVEQLREETSGLAGHLTENLVDTNGRVLEERETHPTADGEPATLVSRLGYDERGRLASREIVEDAHTLEYSYDDESRLTEVSAREGEARTPVLTQSYDSLGRIGSRTGQDGHTWTLRYDVGGNLASMDAGGASAERWTYDGLGRMREHRQPTGGTWRYDYDAQDRLLTETRPDGAATDYGYADARPWPASRSSDALAFTEALEWDGSGRPLRRERELTAGEQTLQQRVEWSYPTGWRTVRTTRDGGEARTFTRETDGLGQQTRVDDGGLVSDFEYDPQGNLLRFGEPGLAPLRTEYDGRGRLLSLVDGSGLETKWRYTGLAQTDISYPDGSRTRSRRDPLGRTRLECGPGAPSRDAEGCPAGALSAAHVSFDGPSRTLVDAEGRRTVVENDARDRPVSVEIPGRGRITRSYEHEDGGLRVQTTDPVGRTITQRQDGLGRPLSTRIAGAPTLDVDIEWAGNSVEAQRPGEDTVTATYDADGRLERTERAGQVSQRRYDGFGQLRSLVDPTGRVSTLSYDDVGRLRSIEQPGERITELNFHAGTDRLETLTAPDGVTEVRDIDPAGRPTDRTWTSGPGVLARERRAYDAAGRVDWRWSPSDLQQEPPPADAPCPPGATCFGYAQGRLASAVDPGGRTSRWDYAPDGQLQTLGVGLQSFQITRDDAGRIASVRNATHPPTRFTYDALDRPLRTIDPVDRVTESEWLPDSRVHIRRYGRLRVPQDDDGEVDPDALGLQEAEHTYDLRGRLTEVEERHDEAKVTIELGWDAQDRPTTYTRADALVSERGYDAADRLSTLTIGLENDAVDAELGYDDAGRVNTLTVDGELRGQWTWNQADRPIHARLDQVTACWRYYTDGSLRDLTWYVGEDLDCVDAEPDQALHAYRLGAPDGRGRPAWVEQVADGRVRTDMLRYDAQDQLVAWHHIQAQTATFLSFDETGRRLQRHVIEWPDEAPLPLEPPPGRRVSHTTYDTDTAGHLSTVRERFSDDTLPVTTDASGHVTAIDDAQLPRDARGRPAEALVDHLGLIASHRGTQVWRDLDRRLVAHKFSGRLRKFLPRLPGFQLVWRRHFAPSWEVSLLRPDASPVAVLDEQQSARTSSLYAPFGQADADTAPNYFYPRGFAGYLSFDLQRSPTPVLDAGHRLYVPEWGRFLAPDPVATNPADPRTADPFGYAYNDPIRRTDPDGRFPMWVAGTVIGVAVDFAMSRVTGAPFDFAHSLMTNAATSVLTGGLGKLAKLGSLAKLAGKIGPGVKATAGFMGQALVDAAATSAIDTLVHGKQASFGETLLGSFATTAGIAGFGRAAKRLGPRSPSPVSPTPPRGTAALEPSAGASTREVNLLGTDLKGGQNPKRVGDRCPACIAHGVEVDTPNGPQPIETLRVGDRVTTPRGREGGEFDTTGLKLVHLLIHHPKHGEVQASLLRPHEWLRRFGIREGEVVAQDSRYEGEAQVLGVEDAPEVAGPPGRVVTGTYSLVRDELVELPGGLRLTPEHRVWSEAEQGWVAAGVAPGGRLLPSQVTDAIDLEVEAESLFAAGGRLVHNCGETGDVPRNLVRRSDDAGSALAAADDLSVRTEAPGATSRPANYDSASPPATGRYGSLSRQSETPGQAHHLNQDAAFRDVIPRRDGASVKLEGSAFTDAGTPHFEAHWYLENLFWPQFRKGGNRFGQRPTNLEYTGALLNSLRLAGMSRTDALTVVRSAVRQRVDHGLLGGLPVPRVPGRLAQWPQ